MMKRAQELYAAADEPPRKVARSSANPPADFHATESLRKQARPYLLATARLPVKVLRSGWIGGHNRPPDASHVAKLCDAFEAGGVMRDSSENYLLASCSAQAVAMLREHLVSTEQVGEFENLLDDEHVPSFKEWDEVVPDEQPELMAGQHRVAAIQRYVDKKNLGDAELWWTCELYDRDALPAELSIKLRANRRDLMLPDSHGQIWMQLTAAFQQNRRLFQGRKEATQQQMKDILQLTGTPHFPLNRLITLWQNQRWSPMITRMCESAVGRDLFNISTWEWLASCRVDDYWFGVFDRILETLSKLPGGVAQHLRLADWDRLAVLLPVHGPRPTRETIRQLFYPAADKKQTRPSVKERARKQRRPGFLHSATDEDYGLVFQSLAGEPSVSFPDVRKLLQMGKEPVRLMTQVLTHVVMWLEPEPTALHDRRRSNKPLIREDVKPRLRRLCSSVTDEQGADRLSIDLERTVLDFARDRIDELKEPATRGFLDRLPGLEAREDPIYAERFAWPFWADLLQAVQDFTGPAFRPLWEPLPSHQADGIATALSTLSDDLVNVVRNMPRVASNPALSSAPALKALSTTLREAVTRWAALAGNQSCEKRQQQRKQSQRVDTPSASSTPAADAGCVHEPASARARSPSAPALATPRPRSKTRRGTARGVQSTETGPQSDTADTTEEARVSPVSTRALEGHQALHSAPAVTSGVKAPGLSQSPSQPPPSGNRRLLPQHQALRPTPRKKDPKWTSGPTATASR